MVAMDGARSGPVPGLIDPLRAVRAVVDGGADAILTTYGMAKATADVLRGQGLIMALDSDDAIADYGVEHALRFGADAVELQGLPRQPHGHEAVRPAPARRAVRRVGHAPPGRAHPGLLPRHGVAHDRERRPSGAHRRRVRRRLPQGALRLAGGGVRHPRHRRLLPPRAVPRWPGQGRSRRGPAGVLRGDAGGRQRDRLRPEHHHQRPP
ncbi:MAG: hypothetical protein WKG07_35810 [Hymenobacter sp.]